MASSLHHIQEELDTRALESLEQRVEALKASLPTVTMRVVVKHGDAHEATLKCAEDEHADMIVMGTHGHTGITHALLGSTAEKVVRLSKVPVLTVRTKG
jgi:nucleotide-binding universal stress UspA family protein